MIRSIAPIDVLTAIAMVALLLFPEAFRVDGVEVAELELAEFEIARLELAEFEVIKLEVGLNLGTVMSLTMLHWGLDSWGKGLKRIKSMTTEMSSDSRRRVRWQ